MSNQNAKPTTQQIEYISFKDPVPVGVGDFASLEAWSRARHGKSITARVEGNWVILEVRVSKIRVPLTNVTSIREEPVS